MELKVGQVWKHYKGGIYRIIILAKNNQTDDLFDAVVYQDVGDSEKIWTQSVERFLEINQYEGKTVSRFIFVSDNWAVYNRGVKKTVKNTKTVAATPHQELLERFDVFTGRFNTIDKHFEKIDERFDILETKVENLSDTVDNLAQMTAEGFARVDARFEVIEKDLNTKATKADIMALHDKFTPEYEFNKLSLRVAKIEEKVG